MSEDEKEKQIGVALKRYSEAKITLAHLDTKLKRVSETYKRCGQAIEQGVAARLTIEHGHLRDSHAQDFDAACLLDEAKLIELLNERSSAEKLVAQLSQEMKDLGISNVK
jgi:hypothetical protein